MTKSDKVRNLSKEELTDILNKSGTIQSAVKVLSGGRPNESIRKIIATRIKEENIVWTRSVNVYFSYTKEQVTKAFDDAQCWSDIYRALNLSICDHNKKGVLNFARLNNINVPTFSPEQIKSSYQRNKRYEWNKNNIFCKDSKYKRSNLRGAALRFNIFSEYKCTECGMGDSWNGKVLTLELDHINGISNDNRKENLRWLCPNCHTQTPTHKGKNRR